MGLRPSRRPSADSGGDAKGEESDDGEKNGFVDYLGGFVLGESSTKRKVWEFLLLIMFLYIAIWFPYDLAFRHFRLRSDPNEPCETYQQEEHMVVLEHVVFAFFWVDLFLNFFLTYRTKGDMGHEEFDIRKIATKYLQFFFWINLLACLPGQALQPLFDVVPIDPGGCTESDTASDGDGGDDDPLSGNQFSRLLRLQRASKLAQMARLVRIVKVGSVIRIVAKQRGIRNLAVSRELRAVNWLAALMWVVHIMACGWYLVAAMHTDHQLTWVASRGLLEEPEGVQWSHSMYFILTVFTTVGFGDMSAHTVGEICYTGVVMMVGAVVHSIVMGEVINLIFVADSSTMWKRKQFALLESYGGYTSLPEETVGRLQDFVRQLDNKRGQYDSDKMYRFLTAFAMPRKLLGELPNQLFNRLLLNNKLVKTCALSCPGGEVPPRFPLLLSTLLNAQTFVVDDVVYQVHDHASHIYLVMGGVFNYVGEVEESQFDLGRNAFVKISQARASDIALTTRLPMAPRRGSSSTRSLTSGKQLRVRPISTVNPPEGRRRYSSREAGRTSSMLEQNFSAWTARPSNDEPWLQMDLGIVKRVKGIVMQGHPKEDQWVKKYKVQYSLLEDGPWVEIEDVFVGCADRSTASQAEFAQVPARFVRVLPVEWHGKISARVGVSAAAPTVYSYRVFNRMDFFGEEVLMGDARTRMRQATARCEIAGEVLLLHKCDLLPGGGGAGLLAEFPEFQRALEVECARREKSRFRRLRWFAEKIERCNFATAGGALHGERAGSGANYAAYVLQVAWRRYSAAGRLAEAPSRFRRGYGTLAEEPRLLRPEARGGGAKSGARRSAGFESRFVSLIESLTAEVSEVKTKLAVLADAEQTARPSRPWLC